MVTVATDKGAGSASFTSQHGGHWQVDAHSEKLNESLLNQVERDNKIVYDKKVLE